MASSAVEWLQTDARRAQRGDRPHFAHVDLGGVRHPRAPPDPRVRPSRHPAVCGAAGRGQRRRGGCALAGAAAGVAVPAWSEAVRPGVGSRAAVTDLPAFRAGRAARPTRRDDRDGHGGAGGRPVQRLGQDRARQRVLGLRRPSGGRRGLARRDVAGRRGQRHPLQEGLAHLARVSRSRGRGPPRHPHRPPRPGQPASGSPPIPPPGGPPSPVPSHGAPPPLPPGGRGPLRGCRGGRRGRTGGR